MKNLDKFIGCLIGGAAGDALGYAVEFLDVEQIHETYGKRGITEYDLVDGVAQISDDTQMTLFTASGLLMGEPLLENISLCYRDWLLTQFGQFPLVNEKTVSPLMDISELYDSRAPGGTCIYAIREGGKGTMEEPLNDSKGCGGVMRVAPVGLFFDPAEHGIEKIDMTGAQVAALTHGHELGYLPAAALAHIVAKLAYEDCSVMEAVTDMQTSIRKQFGHMESTEEMMELIDQAINLANNEADDLQSIQILGEGWVAEETLTIAIYCALKYHDDFEKAMVAAVNHSGDSDSTGAVAGNILGAHLGLAGIPDKFLHNLELYDVILEMADQLYNRK